MDPLSISRSQATISGRELIVTRVVHAPRPLVWKVWTTPGLIEQWWGPVGFTTTTHTMEVREGGVWSYVMHGPELIAYDHDSGIDNDPEGFSSVITFDAQDDRTLVTMHATLPSAERLTELAAKYGVVEGGKQTLARLEEFVRSLEQQANTL
jgi:uncharacterized protein YndB with AHSA1/START domain